MWFHVATLLFPHTSVWRVLHEQQLNPYHLQIVHALGPADFAQVGLHQGSSTFWVRGPIYIFHIILRAAVIADYRIIMDILNINTGEWAGRQVTQVKCLFLNPSVASPTSQALHVCHLANRPRIGGWKNRLWWTSFLQQFTKFRRSYSFG